MGLMDDAKQFAQTITNDLGDFAVPLSFRAPTGETASINGIYADITMVYDENGQPMNGKQTHVSISEQFLIDLGYPTRNTDGFASFVGHLVTINYADGSSRVYSVDDVRPDYTINLFILFLSEYAD